MPHDSALYPVSLTARWTSLVMSILPALALLIDGVMKVVQPVGVVEATVRSGYPQSSLTGIGVALLASTALYLIPRTSFLGAILLTGYLGGAVATNVRVGAGWVTVSFPIFFAVLLWGGLYLRYPRLRQLIPLHRPPEQRDTTTSSFRNVP
jgi:hypothetical protein